MPKPVKNQIHVYLSHVYLSEEHDRLLKAIAGIKDSSVNGIVNEAIAQWLDAPSQRAIIEKFNLERLDEIE